jgi:hypothetical protein
MNPHRKPLLAAAVLSSALTALGQTTDGRNPGPGATSPDPSNESGQNNSSGARAAGATNARIGVGYTSPTGLNFQEANEAPPPSAPASAPAADDANRPKTKRTFWDVLLGRSKHKEAPPSGGDR